MRGSAPALACLGLVAAVQVAFAAPSVTLSTAGNHPQGPVAISGVGFVAGEPVTVTFDTTQVLSLQADQSGAFKGKSFSVPAMAQPGSHTINTLGHITGATVASKFLVITNWSEAGYGPEHTASNPFENTLSTSNVSTLGSAWSKLPPIAGSTAPAILSAGRLFFGEFHFQGTSLAKVYGLAKVQAANGYLAWVVHLGSVNNQITTSPAVDGGVVYVGAADNKIYAVNGQTGAVTWASITGTTNEGIYGDPVVVGGVVYAGSADGHVYALNAANGSVLWTFSAGAKINILSPTVVADVVYASAQIPLGNGYSVVYAINAKTGSEIWSRKLSQLLTVPAIYVQGKIYKASIQNTLYALSAIDGSVIWSKAIGNSSDPIERSLAIAKFVYVADSNNTLYALDLTNGALIWSAPLPVSSGGRAVANGFLYAASGKPDLRAYDAATGSLLWTQPYNDIGSYDLIVADGMLYVPGRDGFYGYAKPGFSKNKGIAPLKNPNRFPTGKP